MVGLAGLFAEGENYGSVRMNAKTVFRGTGSEISALSMGLEIPLALCTLTESGFVADVIYARSADGLSWLPIFRKHYHDDDTDAAGGTLFDIIRRNIPKSIDIAKHMTMHKGGWIVVVQGGGQVIENEATNRYRLELRTSLASPSVANDTSNIMDGGPSLDFASRHIFQYRGLINNNSSILWRAGIGMEYAHSSPDNQIKAGLEGCDGDGINIQVVSADTVGRTKVDSGSVMNPASARTYRVDYNPALNVKYDDSAGFTVSKTTNIPSGGLVDSNRMMRFGLKTITTTQHSFYIYMARLLSKTVDADWF
jgi:hypothetical protein